MAETLLPVMLVQIVSMMDNRHADFSNLNEARTQREVTTTGDSTTHYVGGPEESRRTPLRRRLYETP